MRSYQGLLGLANIILLITSTPLIYLGVSLTAFYLLDRLSFISSWFSVVPSLMTWMGAGSFLVALLGCYAASRRSRALLWVYAGAMAALFLGQLFGIFAAMELRSVINMGEFNGVDVLEDLKDYNKRPDTRERWDALHKEFHCCGGVNFNDGYKIWRNADIGVADNSVPDSCCLRPTPECGRNIFRETDLTMHRLIHTHGCVTVVADKLVHQVVPVLLGYAGVGTVLALIQLLAVVFAFAYSAAITRSMGDKNGNGGLFNDTGSTYHAPHGGHVSVPATPRFDRIRNGNGNNHHNSSHMYSSQGHDNMSHVFQDDTLSMKRKYLNNDSPTPTDMEERDV